MTTRAVVTMALGLVGLMAFGILGTVFSEPVPAPMTFADSSIGLPVPAWITEDGTLCVYVGVGPDRRLLVNRSETLTFERTYWTAQVVDAGGIARMPMPDTPRIQVREEQADGTFRDVIPPTRVSDMARGR
jgi:hypothetical protein